jgi:hypothetical protein
MVGTPAYICGVAELYLRSRDCLPWLRIFLVFSLLPSESGIIPQVSPHLFFAYPLWFIKKCVQQELRCRAPCSAGVELLWLSQYNDHTMSMTTKTHILAEAGFFAIVSFNDELWRSSYGIMWGTARPFALNACAKPHRSWVRVLGVRGSVHHSIIHIKENPTRCNNV